MTGTGIFVAYMATKYFYSERTKGSLSEGQISDVSGKRGIFFQVPVFRTLLFCFAALQALAQTDGSVRGRLTDTAAHAAVPDATVTVLNSRDSSLAGFGRSAASGVFQVSRLARGAYRLLVSHVGYRSVSRSFVVSDLTKDIDLGEIILSDAGSVLDSVTVHQEAPPVTIRHDTIEFNAASFRTRPEAVVEDLEGQARRMIGFLGLEWDEACLSFDKTRRPVKTASVNQVRQPIFRTSVGRWKPYAAQLGPLLEALGVDAAEAAR